MRRLVLFVIIAGLLAACTAPPPASAPAPDQATTGASLPEVTVFRSPT